MKKRITIKDVAREANVAISTVSHVLNGTAKISEPTREKVLEVIQRTNYVPNGYANRCGKKRTKSIGVMVTDLSNEFYTRVVSSIMSEALRENYATIVCEMAFNYKKVNLGMETLLDNGACGIIFVGGEKDVNVIMKAAQKVPVILCDRKIAGTSIPSITTDNVAAMRSLLALLKQWGYERIGYLSEAIELNNLKDRYLGFRVGVEENGFTSSTDHIIFHKNLKLDKALCAKNYIYEYIKKEGVKNLPEIFVTTSDLIAAGAIAALREHGLRVPEDIGVTGFDNISIAAVFDPPLTTIAQNMDMMGKYCFRNILNMINNIELPAPHSVLEAEVIVRKSVLNKY